ncbi:MAG: SDR family oxidoreductase [Candidatus Velthaea sp.]
MSTAIVIGGASGIGRATCQVLARDGWSVLCADRDAAGAEAVAREIGALACGVDIADEASVIALFDRAGEVFAGTIDGVAIPAGIVDTTPFMDIDLQTFRRVNEINVIGTYVCIREAAKRMKPGGRICTVASVAGKRGGGLSGTAAYAASKGAVLALTRNAARSLASAGISVNCVAPGPTMTAMLDGPFATPGQRERVAATTVLNRIGEASEIAEAIAWLLSPKSSFVDGETLTVDGGLMMD